MATFLVDVLDCQAPDLSPVLTAFQTAFGESMSRELDRGPKKEAVERFASLVTSMQEGGGATHASPDAWRHVNVSVMLILEPVAMLAVVESIPGVIVALAPFQMGQPAIALLTSDAVTWRDSIAASAADPRMSVAAVFGEMYRSFCRRGYASLWADFKATTSNGRLLLAHK